MIFDETKYLENAIKSTKSSFKETFSKLREKTDRKEWISGPAVVNAFYSPPANQICKIKFKINIESISLEIKNSRNTNLISLYDLL